MKNLNKWISSILLSTTAMAIAAPAANAGVEELRIGVLAHNICVTDSKNAGKEDGPNIVGEVVFGGPDFFDYILSPRPFIGGSANLSGDTSYIGAGLLWNFEIANGWSIEPSFGIVVHDGELESPFPQGDPRSDAFAEENVLLGSEDLFRTGLALNKDINERWGVQLQFEHLSHGQILGNGRNQGMDSLGVRVIRKFG